MLEQLGIVMRVVGPRSAVAGPGTDAVRRQHRLVAPRLVGVGGLARGIRSLMNHTTTLAVARPHDAHAKAAPAVGVPEPPLTQQGGCYPPNSTPPRQASPGDGTTSFRSWLTNLP